MTRYWKGANTLMILMMAIVYMFTYKHYPPFKFFKNGRLPYFNSYLICI